MRKFLATYISKAWLVSYAAYLVFIGLGYLPAWYLIYPHSHDAGWIAWLVVIFAALFMQRRMARALEDRWK